MMQLYIFLFFVVLLLLLSFIICLLPFGEIKFYYAPVIHAALRVLSARPSVCPSVRLSHTGL